MRLKQFASLIFKKLVVHPAALAIGLGALASPGVTAFAQEPTGAGGGANYFSQIDQDLTIRKLAVFPVRDNLQGIYARPIETQLNTLLKANHQFDLVEANVGENFPTLGELESDPNAVIRLASGVEADAFIIGHASRAPTGLTIKLDLFLKRDGKLIAQEILKDHPRYEIPELKVQVQELLKKLLRKIPYSGIVLSRQGNRVTVNLGRVDGITQNQVLSVIQVIKANRHPKFGFLVSTEKEILGKIKVLKVDETLSFGNVVTELDKGVIKKGSKIGGLDQVSYSNTDSLDGDAASLDDRPDKQISFGKNPEEWKPIPPPSFGFVGLKLGVGSFSTNVSLEGNTSVTSKDPFYPSIGLLGELWLNPEWAVRFEMQQGIIGTKVNGTPIDNQLSRYSLMVGYNVLLEESFFGPKIQVRGGFMNYSLGASPNNTTFAETTYSGMVLGVAGSLPVTEDNVWTVGAGINLVLFPRMQESPFTSGASNKNSVTDFSVFGEKRIRENLRATGSLDFSLYNTTFSGTGSRTGTQANKLSQTHTVLNAGIIYLF